MSSCPERLRDIASVESCVKEFWSAIYENCEKALSGTHGPQWIFGCFFCNGAAFMLTFKIPNFLHMPDLQYIMNIHPDGNIETEYLILC